ncbi:DUF4303 domain-containing protein [Chloroflexia bacterium SDU3-3]|nr:DUF4303 domain-containing protein [Chloroflexia bacterium SDU3-3]
MESIFSMKSYRQFDTLSFTKVIHKLVQDVFHELTAAVGNEHIYVFALYTNDEGSYVLPTANTQEALERTALQQSQSTPELHTYYQQSLRWSPCDWEYHESGSETALAAVNNLLDSGWDDDYTSFLFDPDLIEHCCISALQQLQREKFFDNLAQGSPPLLNLLKGDQSNEERLTFAALLNSPEACAQLAIELDQGYDAYRTIFDRQWREP